MTRHQQEFPVSRPSESSPRLWPPWLGQRPLSFSTGFAPDRSGTGHARCGRDGSNTTRSYVFDSCRTSSISSLTSCDLASQCLASLATVGITRSSPPTVAFVEAGATQWRITDLGHAVLEVIRDVGDHSSADRRQAT